MVSGANADIVGWFLCHIFFCPLIRPQSAKAAEFPIQLEQRADKRHALF